MSVERGAYLEACQHWNLIQLDQIKDVRRHKRICSISKDYDLALAYKSASYSLTKDPDIKWAWQTLERVIRDEEFSNLLQTLPTTAPLVFKENPKRIFSLARLGYNLKQFKLCALLCDAINRTSPRNDALDLGGKAWTQLKNYQAALDCWTKLLEFDYETEKNLDRGSRAAYNAKNDALCFELSLRLHEIRPGYNQHLLLAARACFRSNFIEEKITLLGMLDDASRGSRDALLNICKSYHELNEHDFTEQNLKEALRQHPEDLEFNILYGRFMMNTGSTEKAIEHLSTALDLEPKRTDVAIFLARAYRRLGKLSMAIKVLQLQKVNHPENLNVLTLLGNILADSEDWDNALDVWETIQTIQPKKEGIISKIANCLLKLNRLNEAEALLQESILDNSEDIIGLTMLRQVYWKQSRHEDSLEIMIRLLNLDLENITLWKNVITLSARLARFEEVEIYSERLKKHFGKKEFGALKVALTYQSLSMESEMRKSLDEFIVEASGKPNVLYNAAREFYDLDRADVAFILADEVTKFNSKHRNAGLLMTKIFSHLHDCGMNENWLLKEYTSGRTVSVTQLAVTKMIQSSGAPKWSKNSLEHVAFVAHSVGIGGAERQIINTIKGFEKHVTPIPKISLYCTEWSKKEDKESYRRFINEKLTELKTIVPPSEMMLEAHERLSKWLGEETIEQIPKNLAREITGLYHQFCEEKPSVVHAFHDRINIVAGIAAVMAGVPRIVLSTRSVAKFVTDKVNPFARPIWFKAAYQALLRRPQVQMYHVSKAVSISYDEWLNLPERQKLVLYNSTDYDLMRESSSESEFRRERKRMNFAPSDLIVGGIMRYSSEKRPHLFIETAKIILEKMPNVQFVLIGDGPLMDQVARLVRRYNLKDKIHLIGRSHQIYSWLQEFDSLLLTSEFEGLPNVLIEAQGFGVPVVATDAGGAAETFVHGETGLLVKSHEANDLASSLVQILKDPDWRIRASQMSREKARTKFSIETAAGNFVELYSSIEHDEDLVADLTESFDLDDTGQTNLFVYVDDRNGKAALLASAARKRGLCTHLVRNADNIPNDATSFVYFFIDHLDYRDRDKNIAEGFAALQNIRLAPSIQELRVYDDKGAQQLEYAMMMPPALYSTKREDAEAFLNSTSYPFVSKAIEGAHASNVRLVTDEKQAREEMEAIFSDEGRSRHDKHQAGLTQQGYVLWQKFLPDNPNDWRVIMLGGRYAMAVHRQNRADLPFASGSGLRTPENELNHQITAMLNWARDFAMNMKICVLAADVILDEEGDFVLVETSTTWPTIMHQENVVFEFHKGEWSVSKYSGTDIFDLKADMILNDEFHGW